MKTILSIQERFLQKLHILTDGDCWEYKESTNSKGYGRFWNGDRKVQAHRYSYEWHYKEPIPAHIKVCHHCDNTRCCNPLHMFLGTDKDNIQDCINKGRFVGGSGISKLKTHCIWGHPLSGDNLYVDPKGWRYCINCRRARDRKRYLKRVV